LQKIEDENAGELTPERLAAMEAEAAKAEAEAAGNGASERVALDEAVSPTAGRRFTRA
jgi:hypothetical protein